MHVDDAWAGSTRKESLVEIRAAIGEEYLFKVVDQLNKHYFLSQEHLIEKILVRFNIEDVIN